MILGVTGHRPPKIGGWKQPNRTTDYICDEINKLFEKLKPEKLITGMALGIDQLIIPICINHKVPFIAAVPFVDQDAIWKKEAREQYNAYLDLAEEVVIVCSGGYSARKLQIRNEYIVDNSDAMIAVHDGSKGGTYNCIKYAESLGREIFRIDPRHTSLQC